MGQKNSGERSTEGEMDSSPDKWQELAPPVTIFFPFQKSEKGACKGPLKEFVYCFIKLSLTDRRIIFLNLLDIIGIDLACTTNLNV